MYNSMMESGQVRQKGLTIVELLVTISIIAIIAAIVLSSLNDARTQAVDAKIKAEMDILIKRAGIEELNSLTYDTVCGSNGFSTSTEIIGILNSINSLASSTVTCNSDSTEFAASVPMGTAHWCVDSRGTHKEIGSALAPGVYACP
jgi:prepilin-type N-terminal cleavage/methylation domain-containing protein